VGEPVGPPGFPARIRLPADQAGSRMSIAEKSLSHQGFFGEVVSGITM
jgi:hypothetical protein